MDETIRAILAEHGRLSTAAAQLEDDTDLYGVGLTSHATVTVMLAIEDAFEIEAPDSMLRKGTFQSIGAMRSMVEALTTQTESV